MKPARISFHELSIEISEEAKIPLPVVKNILGLFAQKLDDSIRHQYNISLPFLKYQARTRRGEINTNGKVHVGIFKSKEEVSKEH